MLLPDDALLLFKDKQFAENVVGHDNDDLAEQLDAHGPQLAVGRGMTMVAMRQDTNCPNSAQAALPLFALLNTNVRFVQ